MDQVKTGIFIQQTRKELGYTQKELADKVGVSDKTVSKWETGKGLPDISSLMPLCDALKVNVNELISGQRLEPEEYPKRAEDNMLNLLKENKISKKGIRIQIILGIILLILGIVTAFGFATLRIEWYIDVPTLIINACLCTAIILLSGKREKKDILRLLRKIVIPVGLVVSMIAFVCIMALLGNATLLGPNLAVAILSAMYSMIAYIIIVVIESKISL